MSTSGSGAYNLKITVYQEVDQDSDQAVLYRQWSLTYGCKTVPLVSLVDVEEQLNSHMH